MRIALLWTVLVIAAGVFVAMLVSIRHHRALAKATGQPGPLLEYVWALVPWLLVALCAAPSVRSILGVSVW